MATSSKGHARLSREHDALSVFTIVLAHCLALQVAKDAQSLWWPSDFAADWWSKTVPTGLLAAAIAAVHVNPKSESVLVALALGGVLTLCVNGSQSNHVLLELAIAAAVLLTAPYSSILNAFNSSSNSGSGDVDAQRRQSRCRRRREAFSARMTLAMRGILAVLYAMVGELYKSNAVHT
jgi:hypothetical protein